MTGRIYLLDNSSELVAMEEASYDSEALLQELLAQYPDLLAGEQIDADEPRRWLLVSREVPVPGEQDGAGRWSLDHLFLDQDAVPTLVEVKRSTDTRIRREVIGQMLDYAANAVVYLSVEEIKATFEATCRDNRQDSEERLALHCRDNLSPAEFWQQAKTNLQAGRIRLVFVADEIPSELRRVVEFLNGQMDPAEVIAIEVRQFVGKGMKTLVPRVVGLTETARQKKCHSASTQIEISEQQFLSTFDSQRPPAEQRIARRIIAWAKHRQLGVHYERGKNGSKFVPSIAHRPTDCRPIALQDRGMIVVRTTTLASASPFDDAARRLELLERLRQITTLEETDSAVRGYPAIPLAGLEDDQQLDCLLATFDWVVDEIAKAAAEAR